MPRTANVALVGCVGVTLFIALVVGFLGWRLLVQEEALSRQQGRERLERAADRMLASASGRYQEIQGWLSFDDALTYGGTPVASGAIVVWIADGPVATASSAPLLYYPTPNRPAPGAAGALALPVRPEGADLRQAVSTLLTSIEATEGVAQAEALLRLARVQRLLGDNEQALQTYETLSRTTDDFAPAVRMTWGLMQLLERSDPSRQKYFRLSTPVERTPEDRRGRKDTLRDSGGVPYRLVSLIERARLLAETGRSEDAREEARRIVSEISTGRWQLDKASFTAFDGSARKLAGIGPPPAEHVAIAELVESLWDTWQSSRSRGNADSTADSFRSVTRSMHTSGDVPLAAVVNVRRDRLVALIVPARSLRALGLDLDGEGENDRIVIVDERDRVIAGSVSGTTDDGAQRSLALLGLPWRLQLRASDQTSTDVLRSRRRIAALAYSTFVIFLGAGCYAIALGVLKEAHARRLQSDFLAAVSHEFRSPLTALRQLTEMLAHGRIQDESRRRIYFDVLLTETTRLHRLVEDLLDFGRASAGREHYRFERFDLGIVARDAVEECRRDSRANRHRFEIETRGELSIVGDPEALQRVVRNLLENAVKYSPPASTIWVSIEATSQTAALEVRDEGMGIPAEERTRIFEKFVRGDAAKRACIPGTGLGLSLVQEIVRRHQGTVVVRSEVDRGTSFVVTLPRATTTGETGA